MGYEQLVESQLQDAIARGVFDNLPGVGKPLDLDESARVLAGDNWLGNKILRDNQLLPEWLGIAREVEVLQSRVDELDAQHAQLVALIAETQDWAHAGPALDHALARFEAAARQLRARQDELNVKAPGHRIERPAIWVEFHLQRLEARAVDAGKPRTVAATARTSPETSESA